MKKRIFLSLSLSSQHPFIVPWDSDGCQALSVSALGQAVVAKRGNCTFYTKALNAQLANASSLVIIYNETDLVSKAYMHKRMSNTHTVTCISCQEILLVDLSRQNTRKCSWLRNVMKDTFISEP